MTATAEADIAAPAVLPADPLDLVPPGSVVAVAMSGGVDSSVAAARCVERGLRTIGITLAMWPRGGGDRDRGCCSVDAVDDARRVAAELGIAHYPWNLEEEFRREVIADFEDEYAAGRTPNPCVRCNQRIKFGSLLRRATALGASHVATGHYGRIGRRGIAWTLHRAADGPKDQSYTMHRLGQEQLRRAVLPVGAMAGKEAVRAEARRLGLVTAAKPDSQELCFVEGGLRAELERRLRGRYEPGPIVDASGGVCGRHRGLPFYTVGQRSGLNLAPARPDAPPMYVVALDRATNTVVVGGEDRLCRRTVSARSCSWVSGIPPRPGLECIAQLRAHGAALPATVVDSGGGGVTVRFEEPALHVAPGQALVLYHRDEVLGGGVIAAAS